MTVPPWLLPEDEPGKWIAAAQAAAVYALGLLLLTISVSFQSAAAPPSVEYISLIPTPQVEVAPPPEPEPEPEPKTEPKPVEVKKPEAPKPDIALAEKKKKEEQARKKREAEKKRKAEQRREKEREQKRKEEERRKQEQEEKRKAEEEQEARDKARLAALNAEAREKRGRELENIRGLYEDRITRRVEENVGDVPGIPREPDIRVLFRLRLEPLGKLAAVLLGEPEMIESSGYEEYDKAVKRDIMLINSFPFPPDPELREEFLVITVGVCPVDCLE